MPAFEYTAINPQGRSVKGSIDADSVRTARQRLRAQGIFATEIREGNSKSSVTSGDIKRYLRTDRVSVKHLAVATRQLATLTGAGLPLVGALQALSEQTDSPALQRIIISVRESVEQGSALAKAMSAYPKAFPRLYVNMVDSGEASGQLDAVLENLADYLEAQLELRRKISSALFYPILMLGFCTLVVMGLMIFVVPNIVTIFQKQGAVLPLPTRILIGVSDLLVARWPLLIVAFIAVLFGAQAYYRTPMGKSKIDRLALNLPIYGSLYRRICTARVSSTLGTLLASGVNLLAALDIAKNIINNVHVARAIEEARDGVKEGRSLAKELSRSGIFPNLLSHMIAVGEKSGKMESMLSRAGKSYEGEVNATIAGLTSLLEPVMIIGLGGIVFAIVISILMPMVDLINIVQK